MKEEDEKKLQKRLFETGGTKDERFDPEKNPRFIKPCVQPIKRTENSKYDFMRAADVAEYLGISKTVAYDVCMKINKELAAQGYLTFRGKIPRKALMDRLPK